MRRFPWIASYRMRKGAGVSHESRPRPRRGTLLPGKSRQIAVVVVSEVSCVDHAMHAVLFVFCIVSIVKEMLASDRNCTWETLFGCVDVDGGFDAAVKCGLARPEGRATDCIMALTTASLHPVS